MANIMVVDDDADTRLLLRLHLESADHTVVDASDGSLALQMLSRQCPDLIVSDVEMPRMDGFGLLKEIRTREELAAVPVIFLTSREDRDSFRRGMQLGADDFVNKPVNRKVLLDAVSGRLVKADKMRYAVAARAAAAPDSARKAPHAISGNMRQLAKVGRLADNTMSISPEDIEEGRRLAAERQEAVQGSVLFLDIRNFTTFGEILSPQEVVELLNTYFDRAGEPIKQQCGWIVKLLGDGFVAMFEPSLQGASDHAERALKAGLLMILGAHRFQAWIRRRFPNRALPDFAVGIGIHSGNVLITSMGTGGDSETTVIGDTVNIASRLESLTKQFGWSLCASGITVQAAGKRFETGQSGHAAVKGKSVPVEVMEVTGLLPRQPGESAADAALYAALRDAVTANTAIIQQSKNGALETQNRHSAELSSDAANPNGLIELEGYRLLRKIGEGGMSQVFLAEHLESREPRVLKLVPAGSGNDDREEVVQRFLEEFALISQIHHANVARIHHQGFTASHVYIAMEYFPGGDLRKFIASGVAPDVAIYSLFQILGGLAAIHDMGIVHRDMKPDNVMIRADGSLAIADFGIAKSSAVIGSHTRHGEIFGTPFYIAPEQATGDQVDSRTDLYSTGVMFYEMLMGRRPYQAQSAEALLYQHVHSSVPVLPAAMERFQPLLDGLMAKSPAARFDNGGAVIDFILASGLAA